MTHPDAAYARVREALHALPEGLGRLLGVETAGDGALTARVASDGLSLAQKLALEQGLRAAEPALKVYFARRAGATAAPVPVAKTKGPFGVSVDRRAIPGVHQIIAVASGKGGVGKSTVAVNLAVALAQSGARVGLLDADLYGPSAPLMMGLTGRLPVTSGDKLEPLTAHGVRTVSFGFLTDTREPVIWRGPLIARAFKQLCYDVAWGDLDYLIVDLPPGTGDIQLTMIESLPLRAALIVTTPQDVALLDAHKAMTMFEKLDVPVLGIVENMAGHACSQCGHVDWIFGEGGGERMALERKTKVIAHLPLTGSVRFAGDSGVPVALDRESPVGREFHVLAGLIGAAVH